MTQTTTSFPRVSLVCLLAFALMACLNSPLLNHADADTEPTKDLRSAEEKAACPLTFKTLKLCGSMTWVKKPTRAEKGEFTLRFWNPELGTINGPYIDPGHFVFVKLWMPEMGHGSSPVITRPALESGGAVIPGVFNVTDVYFVMPGEWEIITQLRQDGTSNSVILDEYKDVFQAE